MAVTPNLQLTLLEVGQKEKEITINTNMTLLDTKYGITPSYLGDQASDPTSPTHPLGSTYFNTTSNKLKVLRQTTPSVIWSNAA